MEIEEYSARQQVLTTAFVALVLRMLWPFRVPGLSDLGWLSLLQALFPEVERYRWESAQLGREFFDSQREKYVGTRHDSYLASYRFEWFAEAMEPSRRELTKPGASEGGVTKAVLRAMREVENGGRRTIIRAVETDPVEPRWARVATGRETCAFCLTLISRGDIYGSASDAGMDLDDQSAIELLQTGDDEDIKAAMDEWHTGCDCKVVPVFDRNNWPGRDEYIRAEKLWETYSKLVSNNPDLLIPKNGNQRVKGPREWTKNEAIIAAIRRDIESGKINFSDFAAAA